MEKDKGVIFNKLRDTRSTSSEHEGFPFSDDGVVIFHAMEGMNM